MKCKRKGPRGGWTGPDWTRGVEREKNKEEGQNQPKRTEWVIYKKKKKNSVYRMMVPKFQSQHDTWKSSPYFFFFLWWWQRSERKEIRKVKVERESSLSCVATTRRNAMRSSIFLNLFYFIFFFHPYPGLIFHLHLFFHSTQQTLQGLWYYFSHHFVQRVYINIYFFSTLAAHYIISE